MKVLDVESPLIRCYPHHASFISTVMVNDFDLDDFISNYIQIIYNSDINRCDFNYGIDILSFLKNLPYVDLYCYKRSVIKNKFNSYSQFIEEMINEDCYIHMLIDTYYIKAYKYWYNKQHSSHNITIYGYDDKFFYVSDSFEEGKYIFDKILKEDIDKAELQSNEYDWLYGVYCWKLKEDMYSCLSMNTYKVKNMLYKYVSHKRTYAVSTMDDSRRGVARKPFFYGISVYGEIKKYVNKTKGILDIRIPYVLCEQKKVLLYICKKLYKEYKMKDYFTNEKNISSLLKKNEILVNMFLKYNYIQNENVKSRILKYIDGMVILEKEVIKIMYNSIMEKPYFEKPVLKKNNNYMSFEIDKRTDGNWKNKYGKKGYYVIGDKINLPNDIEVFTSNCYYISLLRNIVDEKALMKVKDEKRVVAYYLNDTESSMEIRNSGNNIKITLFLIDYDKLGRKENICVQEKSSGKMLFEYTIEDFSKGVYISFEVSNDIVISIKRLEGPDAVVSALFFD